MLLPLKDSHLVLLYLFKCSMKPLLGQDDCMPSCGPLMKENINPPSPFVCPAPQLQNEEWWHLKRSTCGGVGIQSAATLRLTPNEGCWRRWTFKESVMWREISDVGEMADEVAEGVAFMQSWYTIHLSVTSGTSPSSFLRLCCRICGCSENLLHAA